MKRLLAALLGLTIFLLPLSSIAEDDSFNPFLFEDDDSETEEFSIDPFSEFADAFEVDPFVSYLGDEEIDEDLFAFAFGEDGSASGDQQNDAPQQPDADTAAPAADDSGTLAATINGEQLVLNYDSSPAFSKISDDLIQAAFYTYGDSTGNLYWLVLAFPSSAKAGDTITPQYASEHEIDASVMLLIYGTDSEEYYIASQLYGEEFPKTSSYSIQFDNVTAGETGTKYEGSMSARMVSYNITSGEIGDSVEIEGASFTLTVSNSSGEDQSDDGSDDVNPFLDPPTSAPSATPPSDYRKV